ncbi:hypothetical protein M23134_05431 [Microscilla marina ATCC 23134]|uniref:Uncharacterized protein n=1 Tax=Microscilla marina ATCC 23134 TaxID=313606 RepID=A1ZHU1_MICM2|nr:hypothetical protein M23134_05431 [Microscilla marina ATCC 23134]
MGSHTPIKVKQIEVFRNLPSFTLEFWYKGTGGNNTIFALDNTKEKTKVDNGSLLACMCTNSNAMAPIFASG